jgi:hypothetical protein
MSNRKGKQSFITRNLRNNYKAFPTQYLLKASMASNGVITGAKYSLLSRRAVWAQET